MYVYQSSPGWWTMQGRVKEKSFMRVANDFDKAIDEAETFVRVLGGKSVAANALRRPLWYDDPPKEYQMGLANLLGIRVPEGATRGQVDEVINKKSAEMKKARILTES
jgi:hypothetical protein